MQDEGFYYSESWKPIKINLGIYYSVVLTTSPLAYDTSISACTTRCVWTVHDGALVAVAPDIAVYSRPTARTKLSLTNCTCICGGRSIYYTDNRDTNHYHWQSFGMFTLCAVHSTLLGSDILSYFVQNFQADCTQQLQHCHPKGCHRWFPIVHPGKPPLVPHTELSLQQVWFLHCGTKLLESKVDNVMMELGCL